MVKGWLKDGAPDLAHDPKVIAMFVADRGRPPAEGELEAIVAATAQEWAAKPDLTANGIRYGLSAIPDILAKSSVQLISTTEELPGFVLPDHPILHGRRSEGLFGFRDAGAVGDADIIVAPTHRRLMAFYTRRSMRNVRIRTKKSVLVVNALLIRSAAAEVACHPADALTTSQLICNLERYPAANFDSFTIH